MPERHSTKAAQAWLEKDENMSANIARLMKDLRDQRDLLESLQQQAPHLTGLETAKVLNGQMQSWTRRVKLNQRAIRRMQ